MRFRRHAAQATPDGIPVGCVFAGVLDGRRLWLAVDALPGRLALRDPDGEVLDLPSEGGDEQPGYLSARLDLAALTRAATYDVVVVDEVVRPVTIATPPSPRVPVAPGGRVRHVLVRADDGPLRLRTEAVRASVELDAVEAESDTVRLTVGGEVVTLDAAGLGATWTPVTVGPDRLPVRRRDDDLADPGPGAPLPSDGRLRLRWSADGLLRARVVEPS